MRDWNQFICSEQSKPYFQELVSFLEAEKASGKLIYPHEHQVFAAFELCKLENLKLVILGQDPYHGDGQAHGLAFSVPKGIAVPPSLRNIKKELSMDLAIKPSAEGDLTHWATQGVFLLNTLLTVESGKPLAHAKKGWEEFTDATIRFISEELDHVIFLLWGNPAQKKETLIDSAKHLILKAAHPSPLSASRGFLGCRHFSKANQQLRDWGIQEISW